MYSVHPNASQMAERTVVLQTIVDRIFIFRYELLV